MRELVPSLVCIRPIGLLALRDSCRTLARDGRGDRGGGGQWDFTICLSLASGIGVATLRFCSMRPMGSLRISKLTAVS